MVRVGSDDEGTEKMSPGLDTITHADYVGTNLDDQNLLLFKRANAIAAGFVILESKHYLELIRAAALGRYADSGLKEAAAVLRELFDGCEGAADAYLKIIRKREENRDADV